MTTTRRDLTRLLLLTYHDACTFSAGTPQGKQKESRALTRDGLWTQGSYEQLEQTLDRMQGPYLRRLKRNVWSVYVDTTWGVFEVRKLNRNKVLEELRPYRAVQGEYVHFTFDHDRQHYADLGLGWIANNMPGPVNVPGEIMERYGYVRRLAA